MGKQIGSLVNGKFVCNDCTPETCQHIPVNIFDFHTVGRELVCGKCLTKVAEGELPSLFETVQRDVYSFNETGLKHIEIIAKVAADNCDWEEYQTVVNNALTSLLKAMICDRCELTKSQLMRLQNVVERVRPW